MPEKTPQKKTKLTDLWRRLTRDNEEYWVGTVSIAALEKALQELKGKGNLVAITIYQNGYKVLPGEPDAAILIEPRLPQG